MKEDFLHYVWQYKKFAFTNLQTVSGQELTIIHSGYYIQQAGPDFFNAQIIIDNQKWAGNVEIHLKSSDWYVHHHETDGNYDNVILHVVWEHDTDVFRKNNSVIPVLELKQHVSNEVLHQYKQLFTQKTWINCENQLTTVDDFTISNWIERLFFERLEKKASEVEMLLQKSTFDWEATFFQLMAKSFGLNTNGEAFLKMAENIPFSVIKKERFEIENIEALFFGTTGLLNDDNEDSYYNDLKKRWNYLKHKYQLQINYFQPLQFFKHRPDNFPTIRLAQLAQLVAKHQQVFQLISKANSKDVMYAFFDTNVSEYWKSHYVFDKSHPKKNKKMSKSFIDLMIMNCILPIKFAYRHSNGNINPEELISLATEIASEKNSIIEKFSHFGLISTNSYHSQAILQLKKEYCNTNKCLNCAIGQKLINFTS
ncbi:DUF2851 family protein [Flavobacterium azooxidireducens]|uniref:DUF2851 family protein n=1 Tax=Flavobacterium azooxidireducens TaxID=1871076 RepID=A0ABY4KFW4_9FLAO|nr:DUF2851 family protein [Flavobacterium azooxidireducens]UPQ79701.1 DUF2851 family protein [Flavobacterium azooxidireducens]